MTKTIFVILAIFTILVMSWSYATSLIVQWRAEEIAGDKAYCIQLGGQGFRYRPVQYVSDLYGLNMQGRTYSGVTSYTWQDYHAVLIVENKGDLNFYNWSYKNQNFILNSKKLVKILHLYKYCNPTENFIAHLQ